MSDLNTMRAELKGLTDELKNYPAFAVRKDEGSESAQKLAYEETKKMKVNRHKELLKAHDERLKVEIEQATTRVTKAKADRDNNKRDHLEAGLDRAVATAEQELADLKALKNDDFEY